MKNNLCKDETGGAIVEFAIIAPLLVTLLIGILEVGLYMFAEASISHSVEVAARCAAIEQTECSSDDGTKLLASQSTYGIPVEKSNFTVSREVCGVRVSADYNYKFGVVLTKLYNSSIKATSCYEA